MKLEETMALVGNLLKVISYQQKQETYELMESKLRTTKELFRASNPFLILQVMYMRYILEHKQPHSEFNAKDIYILALDGDVKFKPEAFLSLMRRLKKSSKIGAACGRIHPIGTGKEFKELSFLCFILKKKMHTYE